MIEIPSEEDIAPLKKLLSFVPEEKKDSLKKRRKNWNLKNEELFKKDGRFSAIKKTMAGASAFTSMDVDALCSDMAYLASFYDNMVELEGIAVAEKTLYSRYYNDNLSLIYAAKIVDGTKAEIEAFCKLLIPDMKDMYDIITNAEYELSLLGIKDQKQTSRSDSIKMLIEVYKKRHDSRKESKGGGSSRFS